jgi:hypothetical protein
MSKPADWARAYARQTDADFRAWELFEQRPETVAAACHKLLFLQMACEKLCKAYLIQGGTPPEALQASHGYIANPLPNIMRQQILHMKQSLKGMAGVITHIRHLANEIEILNPASRRDGQRPDNCEYPWESGDLVISPLDWGFPTSRLCTAPSGRIFLKLLRASINRVLE